MRSRLNRAVVVVTALIAGLIGAPFATGQAPPPLPGWKLVRTGTAGGTVWTGAIPNTFVHDDRPSAVYLPPHFDPARRYPVLYLLHGLPGSPSSFYVGLHLADVADATISATGRPFIAVAPVGGPPVDAAQAEWAGMWARHLVEDVVPWVDAHLPTIPSRSARALAGLCAGGYGAMDIGLRHPDLFGTLESWEGYFAPVFRDGPFVGAPPSELEANDPTLLVRREAAMLRGLGTRFYISVGGNHGQILRRWSIAFDAELGGLGLPEELWLLPRSQRGHFWTATFPSALAYAALGFPAPQT